MINKPDEARLVYQRAINECTDPEQQKPFKIALQKIESGEK